MAFAVARHSETDEPLVIYTPLKQSSDADANSTGNLWARPLNMFSETVDTQEGSVARFAFVRDLDSDFNNMADNHVGLSIGQRILRFFSRKA